MSILLPGQTCWRVARAPRFAVILDAADYYRHLASALAGARRCVYLIGWDFDPRTPLTRDADGRPGETIGALLERAVRQHRHLRVHILRWDLAFLRMPVRGTTTALALDWRTPSRLAFRLDGAHPPQGTHHQKIAVIDDALAFCGGIDVTGGRWDTPEHRDDDPRRTWPDGSPHGPWHDVTTAVDGEAARALGHLARTRWRAAGGRPCAPRDDRARPWPQGLAPTMTDIDVGIARTLPRWRRRRGVREIEELGLAAVAAARATIYIESQYFAAHRVANALARRLAEPDGPEVVIVNPVRADGWLEETAMGAARALLVERLRAADAHGRLRVATPVTPAGADIYVHAKVMIVDDRLLRVGSANVNNRSLGLDSECDVAVDARPGSAAAAAIAGIGAALLGEHLGVDAARFDAVRAACGGSLVGALDALIGREGKTLRPFDPPALTDVTRRLATTRLLDPDWPEPMTAAVARAWRRLPAVRRVGRAAALAGFAGLGWWWWRRRAQRADSQTSEAAPAAIR